MFNRVRALVSQDKIRYKDGGYDLDLSYVTPNIIAMGFPADGVESIYRNPINEVSQFLKEKHGNNFLVFNLTDRTYDTSLFNDNVQQMCFPDHHSPPLLLLFKILSTMESWLRADRDNIVVVHCMAGRGRTGTVVACLLILLGLEDSVKGALTTFAMKRSDTRQGVTNPGQLRYVNYFYDILNRRLPVPRMSPCYLEHIIISPIPTVDKEFSPIVQIVDASSSKLLYSSEASGKYLISEESATIDVGCVVRNDIQVMLYHQCANKTTKFLGRIMFHVGLIDLNETLVFDRHEIDGVHKDKHYEKFPRGFTIKLQFCATAPVVDSTAAVYDDELARDIFNIIENVRGIYQEHASAGHRARRAPILRTVSDSGVEDIRRKRRPMPGAPKPATDIVRSLVLKRQLHPDRPLPPDPVVR